MQPLPALWLERLNALFTPNQLQSFQDFLGRAPSLAFRINTNLNAQTEALKALYKQGLSPKAVDWLENTFLLPPEQRHLLTHANLFLEGKIVIQGLASMVPVHLLAPQRGEEVLDLTAAPGSKTSQIALNMQNQGRLAAVEKSKPRFFKLKENLQRQGFHWVNLYLKDGRAVGKACPERFDRILLDAPCSSESRFLSDDPASFADWSIKKVKRLAKLQFQLLESAWQALKPGGTLVYSTCTFAPEENEMVIQQLLDKHAHAEILPISLPIPNQLPGITSWQNHRLHASLSNTVRILPSKDMTSFYVAKLIKRPLET